MALDDPELDARSLAAYDAAGRGSQTGQGQPDTGRIAPVIACTVDAKALGPRVHLREALNNRGLGLL